MVRKSATCCAIVSACERSNKAVEIAPGPASMGTPSGVTAISSLLIPARVSSTVSCTADRRARSMSSAISRRTMLPAILKAGRLIPRR